MQNTAPMIEMEKEQNIFLLIQTALFHPADTIKFDLTEEEWTAIYQELTEQAIRGIPYEWVSAHTTLPEEVAQKWKHHRLQQFTFFCQLLYKQNELVQLMHSNQIPMAILKGVAAAMYYPDPSARTMGDVDFLVPVEEFERAYQLMLDNGYKLLYDEDHVDYHVTLAKDGITYEIHKEPAGMPEGAEGDYLRQLLANGLEKTEMVQLDGYKIPVLPSLQNGIVLLLHIVKHLKSGLGLRQIIDWMLYVNSQLHDDDWYRDMQPVLANTEFETLAKAVTKMCQMYLGLSQENITWCRDIDDSVCETLIEYIISQGNFGRKVTEQDKGVKVMTEVRNPIQFFGVLQKRGMENWAALQKHSFLRPFAWLYMICRYIKKAFQRKSPIKSLMSDVNDGNERKWLFEQLNLYQK